MEDDLSRIINTIPTHIYVLNTEGSVQYVNQAVMDYTGLSLEDVKQEDYRDRVIHPEDFKRVRAGRAASLRRAEPFSTEQRVLGNDGQYRWFLVRYKPLLDEQERIVRWYVTAFDIEDRKGTEEALRKSERQFRLLVETIPALVWRSTPEGDLDYLNRRAVEYLGHTAESLAGGRWLELVHPDHRDATLQRWLQSATTGTAYEDEYQFRRADGQYRWIQSIGEPFLDTEGRITNWYGLVFDIEDRKRAEVEVQKSESKLRQVIDAIPALAWCNLPDGPNEFLNKGWHEYTGLSEEESHGWGWQTAFHPDDLPPLMERWMKMLASGVPDEIEARLRRHDGVYRWFLIRAEPFSDESGKIVRWYGTSTDIDDRKQAETLLAGEKRLLEMMASGCSLPRVLDALCRSVEDMAGRCYCCVYLIDPSGTKFHNAAAPSLPSSFNDPVEGAPVDRETGPCGMAACLKTQVIASDIAADSRWPASIFRPLALANGLRSCWSTPILSLRGDVLGTFAIYQHEPASPTPLQQQLIARFTHIASIAIERAKGEAALKRSEALLAEAQHLSSIGSFSWCVATDEITWSEQLYRIYELDTSAPVTLELIRTRVHPEDLTLYEKMVEQAQNGCDDFEWQYRLLMPDQSVKYLHAVARATRDQNDELEYIAAVQDVTERRLSEEALGNLRSELAHVSRVAILGALTASIAHEVNQPLSGIITNASTCQRMLNAEPPNIDGARETTRRTIRDGNRASEVITRLRALFSKQEATTESVDLNEATREVIALSLSELQRGRIILRTELSDDLPAVKGDRIQLQQVILNLIRNASDAMSAVGDRPRDLIIRTERDDADRVRLSVQDAGVGFEPQAADRLFQAFYTTKDDGMGIGLSVSRSIIESHHGQLWATSNGGLGATFSFSIPFGPMV